MSRSNRRPDALVVLIALNVLVYVAWHTVGDSEAGRQFMLSNFLHSTGLVLQGRVWTMITAAFSHVDPQHLLFNMLALWVFGGPVARAFGDKALVTLYLLGAFFGSGADMMVDSLLGVDSSGLGASAAVMALSVVYAWRFPENRLLLFFVIPVSARIAVLLFIGMDLLGAVGPSDGVGHVAHLGGALAGAAWVWWRQRGRSRS